MNNFSAKNAEFETVTINNEAAITSANIGTDPNKIPLNKDLGSLAYQDAVNLDDVSADMLELRAIAAEISDSAVDVFVYDTGRDSDGGAWRKRTQHTSWYNEELNTDTRGGRREFPAVAVIVAEANKVTIYDGDDPDLSMWMVFNASGGRMIWATQLSCVSSLNAKISIGSPSSGFRYIDFVSENMREWRVSGVNSISGNISERNNGSLTLIDVPGQDVIVNQIINDVAMTILPNAPIDDDTGLPVPTIAVATDGGVSVIKDDGTVVNSVVTAIIEGILFDKKNNLLYYRKDSTTAYFSSDYLSASFSYNFFRTYGTVPANFTDSSTKNKAISFGKDNEIIIGSDSEGISRLTSGDGVGQVGDDQLAAYTTSKYNTGWMPGDIKLATLSDTTVENIGVNSDELVNNGNFNDPFDQANDGWYDQPVSSGSSDAWSISASKASHTGNQSYLAQDNVFEEGKRYALTFSVTGIVILPKQTGLTQENITFSDGTHTYVGTAIGSSLLFYSNTDATIDNISVRATTELITNGDFSNGTTGWNTHLGSSSVVSGTARLDANNTTDSNFTTSITCVVGETYVLSADAYRVSGDNSFGIAVSTNSGSNFVANRIALVGGQTNTSVETKVITFTATATTHYVGIQVNGINSTSVYSLDNISVRPAVDDRSVNNNGLQVIGEINKTPVAPGADLVAYSGFSANNYLVQPYNEDLDFGTGDFCVMGWFKQSPTTDFHTYFDRNGRISVYVDASTSKLNFRITDGTNHMNCLSARAVDNDTWTFFVGVKSDGVTYNYINGELSQTANYATVGSLDGQFSSSFGVSADGLRYADTMTLWRISATAPTTDQIAKIYRDEKALFQDGVQATLYGGSDAVTALSYDEKTELLHVGTASGRSDFSGLRRINNTTTAITTSISAHNNLIAEQ